MLKAIKFIYPDIQDSHFLLQDDGNGPYIKQWNYNQPKPTKAQLDEANIRLQSRAPSEVSMAQARLALLKKGYLQQVQDYITSLTGAEGDASKIEWEFRQSVKRTHPLVSTIASGLNLTDLQMDDLFKLANTL